MPGERVVDAKELESMKEEAIRLLDLAREIERSLEVIEDSYPTPEEKVIIVEGKKELERIRERLQKDPRLHNSFELHLLKESLELTKAQLDQLIVQNGLSETRAQATNTKFEKNKQEFSDELEKLIVNAVKRFGPLSEQNAILEQTRLKVESSKTNLDLRDARTYMESSMNKFKLLAPEYKEPKQKKQKTSLELFKRYLFKAEELKPKKGPKAESKTKAKRKKGDRKGSSPNLS